MANLLGVDQALNGAITDSANFNRAGPDLASRFADSVRKRIGDFVVMLAGHERPARGKSKALLD